MAGASEMEDVDKGAKEEVRETEEGERELDENEGAFEREEMFKLSEIITCGLHKTNFILNLIRKVKKVNLRLNVNTNTLLCHIQ